MLLNKRNGKYIGCLLLFMVLVLFLGIPSSYASSKIHMKKSMTIEAGKRKTLKINNKKKRISWTTSDKAVVALKAKKKGSVVCIAKKTGNAVITAKIGKKKYRCKITVTEKTSPSAVDEKTYSGYATYYTRVSPGCSNLDDYEAEYLTAAMNKEDYNSLNLAGAYIEVTDKDGDSVKVMITDLLPEGAKGDIDLCPEAFEKIEPKVTGKMKITWKIIPLPTADPIYYKFKPTSSQYWAEVQVRNHVNPIKALEVKNSKGEFVELERKEYNYFCAPSGMGKGPFTFRVTDIYGNVLVDEDIPLDTNEKLIPGKANF